MSFQTVEVLCAYAALTLLKKILAVLISLRVFVSMKVFEVFNDIDA